MNRTLFNNKIRQETTAEMFPDKMDINDFREVIIDSFDTYKENMAHLGEKALKPKYIEEWVEQYLSWLEIEEERK